MTAQAEIGKIQHRRDHDQPAHADALAAAERTRHLGHPEPAIAFADQKFDRTLPAIALDPFADRDRERVGVAVDRKKLAAHSVPACHDVAIARQDRIDKDQVGEVEPGLRIVDHRGRRRSRYVVEGNPPRTDGAEIKVSGRRAGAAVEQEGDRAAGVAKHIGDEGDFRLGIAGFGVVERNRSGSRLEPQSPVRQFHHVFGGRIGRQPHCIVIGWPCRTRSLAGRSSLCRRAALLGQHRGRQPYRRRCRQEGEDEGGDTPFGKVGRMNS